MQKQQKKPLSQLSHNAYSIIYSIVNHCPTLLRPAGARWMGERSPRHRGCALRACLLPELLSASGASQYHHTHCPTSANAAGTANPINNPTLRSDSDAGWGQQNQLNSSPNARPPFVPPTVPPPKNKFEKLEIANSLIKIKKLVPSCLLVVSQLLFYNVSKR